MHKLSSSCIAYLNAAGVSACILLSKNSIYTITLGCYSITITESMIPSFYQFIVQHAWFRLSELILTFEKCQIYLNSVDRRRSEKKRLKHTKGSEWTLSNKRRQNSACMFGEINSLFQNNEERVNDVKTMKKEKRLTCVHCVVLRMMGSECQKTQESVPMNFPFLRSTELHGLT